MTSINTFQSDKVFAESLDSRDPLASFRNQFHIPKTESGAACIYLCGNSLGLQPKTTKAFIDAELQDWATLGVEGHFHAAHPWMPYHEFLTEPTARLVGAKASEVVVMNSLTVNLHLLMVSFYRPTSERYKILIERGAFPSDQYAVKSQLLFHGFASPDALIELAPRDGEETLRTQDILSAIEQHKNQLALILLGGVNYYTGQCFDMKTITAAGHQHGCTVGFDLAHAAGNVELHLHEWGADFAAWCSYKYLNSGPGSVAGAFVHERFATADLPRFAGWWGHDKTTRFKMGDAFFPIAGAEGWQLSNPPILSLAAIRASMEIFDTATMPALRKKSEQLTAYLEFLLRDVPEIEIITPKNPAARGAQLSLKAKQNGRKIFDALTQSGIVCDWREPNVIRVAPVPLYNTFLDVWRFVAVLKSLSLV
jgi:kynureninase